MAISMLLEKSGRDKLNEYKTKIELHLKSGTAHEETYYSDFANLLESMFPIKKNFLVQANPRDEKAESKNLDKPDFIISYLGVPIIRIEAKNPNSPISEWVKIESGNRLHNQVFRYRGDEDGDLPVAITDFLTVWGVKQSTPNRLDLDHQLTDPVDILQTTSSAELILSSDASPKLLSLYQNLCVNVIGGINKISKLIKSLIIPAKTFREKLLEVLISDRELTDEEQIMKDYMRNIENDFQKLLAKKQEDPTYFASLLVETITYSLFVSWMRFCREGKDPKNFTISFASDYLPFGSFIRQIFSDIRNIIPRNFTDRNIKPIESIFQNSHFPSITADLEDLMTSFYSAFLWEFDPETARKRGVISTPHEIVDFILKGTDFLLKTHFNKDKGLLDNDITFLDPASGTMTFSSRLMHFAKDYFSDIYSSQQARIPLKLTEWFKNQFLRNVYAFEILMAPYALGHLRIGITAREFGINIGSRDRVNLYLINSLMDDPIEYQKYSERPTKPKKGNKHPKQIKLTWFFRNPTIEREARKALNVRNIKPILVVMGNPPYSVSTQNRSEWIETKMVDYKIDLNEPNIQPLSDDYVKFIRFAQWKIKNTKSGIIGFITNNSYLDGRIFRIMRKELCKDFDYIYIVNLHGNVRLGESGNPFGIKVGVSIAFFIRTINHSNDNVNIKYKDISYQTKKEKFMELAKPFDEIEFLDLPMTPQYYFIPLITEEGLLERYNSFIPMEEIFNFKNGGTKTHRDRLLVNSDLDVLKENLQLFFSINDQELGKRSIKLRTTRDWDKDAVQNMNILAECISNIITGRYRGFDERFICFDERLIEQGCSRIDLMNTIDSSNIAICVTRQAKKSPFNHVFITENQFDIHFLGSETAYGFPLMRKIEERLETNINIPSLKFEVKEFEIFCYIYGVLHSNIYKTRYEEPLLRNFPRIPFSEDNSIFRRMGELGKELINLHLIKSKSINPTRFPLSDYLDLKITKISYNEDEEKIYLQKISKREPEKVTWIGGITQEMWDFRIGDNPQIYQWLYARKFSSQKKKNTIPRALTDQELDQFLKICDIIGKTIDLIPKIDDVYQLIDPE